MTGTNWGGSLPPGAANDPTAPYNQHETPVFTCDECGEEGDPDDLVAEEVEHADGAVTVNYLCPDCGEVLDSRLADEPDHV